MKGNAFVIFALRSPLHVFVGETMLITVTGRNSGRKITLPVNYLCEGNDLWVLSSRDRTWWRNLTTNPCVEVRLHGHDFRGAAEVMLRPDEVATRLMTYLFQVPSAARSIGVRVEKGVPNREDVDRVACERLFVRVRLD